MVMDDRDGFDVHNPHWVTYEDALARIGQGWLGQYRGGLWGVSGLIRWGAAGAPHTHSAMFERTQLGVNVLELREFRGGRSLPLRNHVVDNPGRIDVFSPNAGRRWPQWDADGAVRVMRGLVGNGYGYRGILRLTLRHLPFVWRFLPVETRDVCLGERDKGVRPFCSHAIAIACQVGGHVDPVPRLPDYLVEPCHLTWSLFFRYEFSIAPLGKEAAPWVVPFPVGFCS